MTKKLFIDFDETLFCHRAYLSWVDKFLSRRGHLSETGAYMELSEEFHENKGEQLVLYDHGGHIKTATGKDWSFMSGELEKEIRGKGHDFCYPDAHGFLEKAAQSGQDVRILTYGHGEYQLYKIRTCSVLRKLHIPVHVVHEPKRVFLKREFAGCEGILIDDKHPLRLPSGWTHIWINRKNNDSPSASKNVQKVKSLKEVEI